MAAYIKEVAVLLLEFSDRDAASIRLVKGGDDSTIELPSERSMADFYTPTPSVAEKACVPGRNGFRSHHDSTRLFDTGGSERPC